MVDTRHFFQYCDDCRRQFDIEFGHLTERIEGYDWYYKFAKLYELIVKLYEYKPTTIVELGSGYSTLLLDEYQQDTNCIVYSIEESEQYLEETKKIVGHKTDIKFILCERKQDGEDVWYELGDCLDNVDIDLCYVDGPSSKPNDFCLNPLQLDAKVFLFDLRVRTVLRFIRERKDYEFKPSPFVMSVLTERPCIDERQYHNIFERKE